MDEESAPAIDFTNLMGSFVSADELRDQDNPLIAGWQFCSLADAYLDRPPVREVVAGISSEASLTMWYGAPGSKKSLILADLCACAVAGKPWLSHLPDDVISQQVFPATPTAVGWLDFDNGTRRTHDRFAAFGRAYNLAPDVPFHYLSMATPWLDMSKRPMAEHLARVVYQKKIGLLVVDNLGVTIGTTDENSSEMSAVMSNWRWLVDSTGVAAQVVHHQRKSSPINGNGAQTTIGRAEMIRGHSSILANLDQAFHVEAVQDEDTIIITPSKQRDGLGFSNLSALFTYEHKDDDRTLQSARFYGYARLDAKTRQAQVIEAIILKIVRKKPGIGHRDLVQESKDKLSAEGFAGTGFGRDQVRGAVVRLGEDGRINIIKGEKSGSAIEYKHYPA